MNDVQNTLLSMYKDVKRILDANGIRYYVQFGTAIGAVRHDGFIPWDDDIDLLVWDKDLPRINKLLSEGLDDSKYYYHAPSADTHPHVIFKGEDIESGLRGRTAPFIDIFPLAPYPTGAIRRHIANLLIWGNVGSIWAIDHVDSTLAHRLLRWIPMVFRKMADYIAGDDSEYTVIYATQFKEYIFPAEFYGTPEMHVFEDTEVPLPCENHVILTAMYGDYMTPPPADKRTGAGGFPCSAYKDYIMTDCRNCGVKK